MGTIVNANGFRLNVGIIITNKDNQLLWCQRVRQPNAWQFPQGGVFANETLEEAMLRELYEELGLQKSDVECLLRIKEWLYYRLPKKYHRYDSNSTCIGQKQKWFLLRLIANEQTIELTHSSKPEFDQWRWVDYWYPLDHVIAFKRKVYKKVLTIFEPILFKVKSNA